MARIKYVLHERRRAAIEAGSILAKRREEQGIKTKPEPIIAYGVNDKPAPPHPSLHLPKSRGWAKFKAKMTAEKKIEKRRRQQKEVMKQQRAYRDSLQDGWLKADAA